MGRRLPIAEYKGKRYFLDDRLRQIRNVDNPHDFSEIYSYGIKPILH